MVRTQSCCIKKYVLCPFYHHTVLVLFISSIEFYYHCYTTSSIAQAFIHFRCPAAQSVEPYFCLCVCEVANKNSVARWCVREHSRRLHAAVVVDQQRIELGCLTRFARAKARVVYLPITHDALVMGFSSHINTFQQRLLLYVCVLI